MLLVRYPIYCQYDQVSRQYQGVNLMCLVYPMVWGIGSEESIVQRYLNRG